MEGGPMAFVEKGDRIKIDIPERRIDLLVDDRELTQRKAQWHPPRPKITRGYLARYAGVVTSAHTGAIVKRPDGG
jgi:dihydroxy-acid dehydratase